MGIIQFIEARLNEDEAVARGVCTTDDDAWIADNLREGDAHHIARHDRRRGRGDVAVKRALIDEALHRAALYDNEYGCCHQSDAIAAGQCKDISPEELTELRILAAIWCEHPDYQPAWAEEEE